MQPQPKVNVINGVPVDGLFATIDAIKRDPSLAAFQFRARNRWLDGGHNRSLVKDFYGAGREDPTRKQAFTLDAGEPQVLLGRDEAPNPVEYVLHALAACVTSSMVYHAAAKGIAIQQVESRLDGDIDLHGFLGLDPDVPRGYREIRMKFRVRADVPDSELAGLLAMGQKFSPVFDTVTRAVTVKVELEK